MSRQLNFSSEAAGRLTTLFPTNLPEQEWVKFSADGFSVPVTGVIYRKNSPVVSGMPLGGIDTGCLDLETSGLFGYTTIFNSHVPRGGPINKPFLAICLSGKTWLLTTGKMKRFESPLFNIETGDTSVGGFGKKAQYLKVLNARTVKDIHYWGHYPVGDLEFEMDAPISVGLRAWSPFIPGDLEASMLPGVVFEVHLRNISNIVQAGTVAFTFPGLMEEPNWVSKPVSGHGQYVFPDPAAMGKVSYWARKKVQGYFNGMTVTSGRIGYALGVIGEEKMRVGGEIGNGAPGAWTGIGGILPAESSRQPGESVAVDFSLRSGEVKVVRFVLSWHSPEWKGGGTLQSTGNTYTHMYSTRYGNALHAAEILARDHQSLLQRILAWQEAIYSSREIPGWLQDSLINILHLITETGMWAAAESPIGTWCRAEDGLFGMNECPRGCPQIECLPCSFYGNIPLSYFFPKLALSTLRGYKTYQHPNGAAPWIFGGATGGTEPIEMVKPTPGYQTILNGPCFIDMFDRYWLCTKDEEVLKEFYESLKQNTIFTMNLRPEYEMGDRIIAMPTENVGSEWFEAPEPGWRGLVTHVGGIHLASLLTMERLAKEVGDQEFAEQCRVWFEAGRKSMEKKLWAGRCYLNYHEPETDSKSDLIFAYQLDGEWMAKFHGLPGVFRPGRVKTTLETIKNTNIPLTKFGAVNYTNSDGSKAQVGGYGPYSTFPPELLMLAMTYMYNGEKKLGLEIARRSWHNIHCRQCLTWDQPNILRGDKDTGERVFGADYYQNMMLWSLPAAMEGKDLSAPLASGGLVDRVIEAGRTP